MKLSRIKSRKKGKIEIIPMIDVMFFLLATFIIASISIQNTSSLNFELPKANTSITVSKEEVIRIELQKNGQITIDNKPTTAQNLDKDFKDVFASKKPALILADKSALHGDVISLMSKIRDLGITQISVGVTNK